MSAVTCALLAFRPAFFGGHAGAHLKIACMARSVPCITISKIGLWDWDRAPHRLAIASLFIMPLVSWGKLCVATIINSAALRSEAKETLACSYLSFTLSLGLGANAAAGWWRADPIAALLMVPWLVKEGLEGLQGEHCCEH